MKRTQKLLEHNKFERKMQQLTFPMDMEITIPENDPVRLLSAQLEELDYRELYRAYSSTGRESETEPRILFEVLVYGYQCGIYSTRKLEEACRKRMDFMWLLQGKGRRRKRIVGQDGPAAAQRPFQAEHYERTGDHAPDQPLHSGGRSLWGAEKRPQIQALPHPGPDEHFHGALSFVPGVQPEQAVGEMQRRTAANTFILRPKRIVFENQKNKIQETALSIAASALPYPKTSACRKFSTKIPLKPTFQHKTGAAAKFSFCNSPFFLYTENPRLCRGVPKKL